MDAGRLSIETTQNDNVVTLGIGAQVSSHAVCLAEPGNRVPAFDKVRAKAYQSATTAGQQGTASQGFHCLKLTLTRA